MQIFRDSLKVLPEGVGLGHEFLRHIERTKVMIHMVDAASVEGRDPIETSLRSIVN